MRERTVESNATYRDEAYHLKIFRRHSTVYRSTKPQRRRWGLRLWFRKGYFSLGAVYHFLG